MGWIDVLNEAVRGLRARGKKEQEIKEIVATASDKATVTTGERSPVTVTISADGRAAYEKQMAAVAEMASKAGTNVRDAVDAMPYAVNAIRAAESLRTYTHRESNNYRRMHGLPMRRKRGKRHGRAGSSHRH